MRSLGWARHRLFIFEIPASGSAGLVLGKLAKGFEKGRRALVRRGFWRFRLWRQDRAWAEDTTSTPPSLYRRESPITLLSHQIRL